MLMRAQSEGHKYPPHHAVSIAHWAVEYNIKNFYVKSALKSTEILYQNTNKLRNYYEAFYESYEKKEAEL